MTECLDGYLAPEGFGDELEAELQGRVVERWGRLFLAARGPRPVWAQNVWWEPERVAIRSIKDGARQLRARQRNWALHSTTEHRRAALIQEQLPHVSAKPIAPFGPLPNAPLGSWTLLDRTTILCAERCSSPFPHGEARFIEDRTGPPSRAYLKLWEALTLHGRWPAAGDRVIDLGSSPGGWTWVLAELGADVISVDKAPLHPTVDAMPSVRFERGSAFALDPREHPVQWVFSDVICYPERLWSLVQRWMTVHPDASFVCSIKLQGAPGRDLREARAQSTEIVRRFAAIEGAWVGHLAHNRHELTWVRLAERAAQKPPASRSGEEV